MGASRRRFLRIVAAVAGCGLLPGVPRAEGVPVGGLKARVWRGTALGAAASIRLFHPDEAEAGRLIGLCLAEVERLERVFSLYRADSALLRLNRTGDLRDPPGDLARLLSEASAMSTLSGGAFDVTVQPLWELYAGHVRRRAADPAGPPPAAVAAVRALVDHRAVEIAADRVRFRVPGMAATLNGIAQGYITDRVAELLRRQGLHNVLLDLGEIRALDGRPDGTPWRVGLDEPAGQGTGMAAVLAVADSAVATSSPEGTPLDADGRFTHLFDPATGRPAQRWRSVTVTAPQATLADGLSTALAVLPEAAAAPLLAALPTAGARLTRLDGTLVQLGRPPVMAG